MTPSFFINITRDITEKRSEKSYGLHFLTCTLKRSSKRTVGLTGLAKRGVLIMVKQSRYYCESEVKTPLPHLKSCGNLVVSKYAQGIKRVVSVYDSDVINSEKVVEKMDPKLEKSGLRTIKI